MTRNELRNQYFDWMYQLVCNKRYMQKLSYRFLLEKLDDIPFYYENAMDSNRAADGIDLRYRFGAENNYDDVMIASLLDDHDCSVLEMMVALSIRCEENIMNDPSIGNRTGDWFWDMIRNMHLQAMTDMRYDDNRVENAVYAMLDRRYSRNGDGGLFYVKNPKADLRNVEIWYQMCWHLEELD